MLDDQDQAHEKTVGAYTPGPWRVGHWGGQCNHPDHVAVRRHPCPPECVYEPYFSSGYGGIAGPEPKQMVVDTHYDELVISDADACLIAAAPELLEACKLALIPVDDFETAEARRNVVRAAIAKAEGRSVGSHGTPGAMEPASPTPSEAP